MKKILSYFLNSSAFIAARWNGSFAFRLLCRVKRTNIDKSPNKFLDQASSRVLQDGDYRATLYTLGSGDRPILLLHGWKSYSARWEQLINMLDLEKYTIYAIDAPAHGRSPGDSLNIEIYRRFMVQAIEDIGKLHAVIAHSLGGLVTAYAYLDNPQLAVDRFVITGAPAGMQSIYDFFKRVVGLNQKVIDNMNQHIAENVTKIPPLDITLARFFTAIDKPVLVIHDETDRVCPIGYIKDAIPQGKIHAYYTKGLGHDLQDETVYERTKQFLEDLA
ncbi:alpha/beta fold hydrolase [Nonlabens ponticola]|uniref:Alpha/beta hydrolase n=1 Tax=Nonlabens ponticola TaxID=2496866 RepID=A0A3S9MV29_9FLAO|nr:alpha/beta fold hydrolase [Nonlabens ponticola]AZQ43036.1 alpha/beta hydrolase [Nonlabens ponticola]